MERSMQPGPKPSNGLYQPPTEIKLLGAPASECPRKCTAFLASRSSFPAISTPRHPRARRHAAAAATQKRATKAMQKTCVTKLRILVPKNERLERRMHFTRPPLTPSVALDARVLDGPSLRGFIWGGNLLQCQPWRHDSPPASRNRNRARSAEVSGAFP